MIYNRKRGAVPHGERFPKGSSVALDFETDIGELRTDLISGSFPGSYMYSFNGGGKLIHASLESGILTVRERTD